MDLPFEGPLTEREEPHRGPAVDHPSRRVQEVGVRLVDRVVRHRSDQQDVGPDTHLGAHVVSLLSRATNLVEDDPVDDHGDIPSPDARDGLSHSIRHGDVRTIDRESDRVHDPRRHRVGGPRAVLRRHHDWARRSRQGAHDHARDGCDEWRVQMQHVDGIRDEHSSEA